MYYIYMYKNKVNGKMYIGQTNNLKKRYNCHKSDSFNEKSSGYYLPLHCAIRKYGLDNFEFVTLEEIDSCESAEYVNDREIYYIDKYKSLKDENGYNITSGGDGSRKNPLSYEEILKRSRLFSGEEIMDIQNRLINDEEFDDIEKHYAPRLKRTFLVNINTGTNFYNPKFSYPLKKNAKSKFTNKEIRDIKEKIKQGIKYSVIQEEYDIKSAGFLSMINTGKYFYDKNDSYPLCDKGNSSYSNKVWIEGIINDLLNSNLTQKEICEKWSKSKSTVYKINTGRAHKKIDLSYPLRKLK